MTWEEMNSEVCNQCGEVLSVGEWPWCPHGRGTGHKGFEAFFDEGLGQVLTGFGDMNKACRPRWEEDHIVHIQPRDKTPQYYKELNERRRDRAETEKRERARQ